VSKQLYLTAIVISILLIPLVTAGFKTYIVPDNTIVIINSSSDSSSYKSSGYRTFVIEPSSNTEQKTFHSTIATNEVKKSERVTSIKKTQSKPAYVVACASPTTAHLYNDVLNISINEKYSGSSKGLSWKYKYDGINWGDSNYYEHYGFYTKEDGLITSENLSIITSFNNPNGTGTAIANLSYSDIIIERAVTMFPGESKYFQIDYTITVSSNKTDFRFFQIIDFDVPDTGSEHQCDDNASYNSLNDYVIVEDSNNFKNGFSADRASTKHGISYYSEELYNDWKDYNLNNNADCSGGVCTQDSCTDPAVGLQYNLGNLSAGEQKQITFTIWFGQPTGFLIKEISIYPAASFDQETKQLKISAYIYDNNIGEKVTNGSVNYYVYDSSNVQKKSGSLTYNQTWEADVDLSSLCYGDYYVKINYNNYEERVDFSIVRGYGNIEGNVLFNDNLVSGATVNLYRTSSYFYGYSPTSTTTTNSTGGFNFSNVLPGSYLIEAINGSNIGRTLCFYVNGKDDIIKNVTIGDNTTLSYLAPYMKQLSNKISAQMIYETDLIAEISKSAKNDLSQSSTALTIEDFIVEVINGNISVDLLTDIIKNFNDRLSFAKALNITLQALIKSKPNNIATEDERKSTLEWIVKDFPGHSSIEFKDRLPYNKSLLTLTDLHTNFTSKNLNIPPNFDLGLANEIVASQKHQLDSYGD